MTQHQHGGPDHSEAETPGVGLAPSLIAGAEAAGVADRVRFRCVEPGPLPVDSESVDVVFSKDAIMSIPRKAELLAEIGELIVCTAFEEAAGARAAAGHAVVEGPRHQADDVALLHTLGRLDSRCGYRAGSSRRGHLRQAGVIPSRGP